MTLLEVIKKTGDFFDAKGIQNGRLNAEHLVGSALKLKRMQLYLQFERTLSDEELDRIRQMAKRRGQREPLQHIVGEVDFHGLKLKVDRRALIPRPETERLVEILIERCADPVPARVLDLGTGGGAIALALAAAWTSAAFTAVDLSEEALALARENAAAAGHGDRVNFICSDWFAQVEPAARFDLVVANPPYLTSEETRGASPRTRACADGRGGRDGGPGRDHPRSPRFSRTRGPGCPGNGNRPPRRAAKACGGKRLQAERVAEGPDRP